MTQFKEKSSLTSYVDDCDWTNKTGKQVVELHANPRTANFSGSYVYKTHITKDGTREPAGIKINILSYPDRVEIANNPQRVDSGQRTTPAATNVMFEKIVFGNPRIFEIDFDSMQGKALYFGLSKHPDVRVMGEAPNPNSYAEPSFELVIRSQKSTVLNNEIQEKMNVLNTINAYSHKDCLELIYYMGKSPFYRPGMEMTHLEAKEFLMGKDLHGEAIKNMAKFKKFHQNSSTPERELEIALEKGRQYGIIIHQDGFLSFNDGLHLGSETEAVKAKLSANEPLREKLFFEISKRETNRQPQPPAKEPVFVAPAPEKTPPVEEKDPGIPVKKGPFGRPAKVKE